MTDTVDLLNYETYQNMPNERVAAVLAAITPEACMQQNEARYALPHPSLFSTLHVCAHVRTAE